MCTEFPVREDVFFLLLPVPTPRFNKRNVAFVLQGQVNVKNNLVFLRTSPPGYRSYSTKQMTALKQEQKPWFQVNVNLP